MVKNNGGNKTKRMGRKFASEFNLEKARTRFRSNEDEFYACCVRFFGNRFLALCDDGIERSCVLRKKFTGRSKRDNQIVIGTWALVGRRAFETGPSLGKLETCDLLEVYGHDDKSKLIQHETHINWKSFNAINSKETACDDEISFDFTEQPEETSTEVIQEHDSDIDFDDI